MDEKPIFDKFLPIRGTLEVSHLSQISSSTVLFVHLTLVDNDTTGNPFGLAHNFLLPYFPRGGMKYCEIVFDFGSQSKIATFHAMVSKIVSNLALASGRWERIVFGVSDHTDNANGDPFAGYTGRKKSCVAAPVDNVSAFVCHLDAHYADCESATACYEVFGYFVPTLEEHYQ